MPRRDYRSKMRVLEAFLQFVQTYVSLPKLHIGTLGGEGLEANIWLKAGLPQKHGWLVEWDEELRSSLRAQQLTHWFNMCNALARLPATLARVSGPRASFDAFHFDLCGFVRSSLDDIKKILPLLLQKTGGKCLAITTVDRHANQYALEHEKIFDKIAGDVGVERTRAFMRELKAQQKLVSHSRHVPGESSVEESRASLLACVQREIGTFADVLHLLKGRHVTIDEMVRYVYISRWSGSGWRMRSYFFHFSEKTQASQADQVLSLMERWTSSPLLFVSVEGRESAIKINRQHTTVRGLRRATVIAGEKSQTNVEIQEVRMNQANQALSFVAQMLGGNALKEYEELAAKAKQYDALRARVLDIASTLTGAMPNVDSPATPSDSVPSSAAEPAQPANPTPQTPLIEAARRKEPRPSRHEIVTRLIRAQALSDEAYVREMLDIAREMGWHRDKNYRRRLGTMYSHAMGKYRSTFLYSLYRSDRARFERELPKLAADYSKIEGKDITVKMLLAEAKQGPEDIRVRMQRNLRRAGRS